MVSAMRVREGLLVAVATALLASGSAAAQETQAPGAEPVATVGDVPIAKAAYDHWLAEASHSHFRRRVELLPPGYEQCVTAKRRQRAAKRWRLLDPAELRRRCRLDHNMLHRTVVQFLIQAEWIQQEASRQGISVGPRRVERLFESQKRAAFPSEQAYQRFLRTSGSDEVDIKFRIRLDALQNGLTRLVTERARPVTKRDVARYRSAHPRRFADLDSRKAERRIRGLLQSQREQASLGDFIEGFRSRSRARTWCADGYVIEECGALAPPS